MMIAGAVFVSSMVVWMWKTGKRLKQEIETKLSSFSGSPTRMAALGLFLFVFLMVFREGIETVISLAAVSLRTSELLSFMGSVIGLSLAVGLGVAFFKGSLKVNFSKFFAVTSLVLLVVAAQLLITGLHELSEAGFLPASQREMRLVGPLVNNEVFFFLVVVALALFLVVAQRIQEGGIEQAELEKLPAPERRKARAEQRRDRFWKIAASAASILVLVLVATEFIYSRPMQDLSPPERLSMVDGELRVPISSLLDKKLHRYEVSAGGADVRLIAILDASETVRAALDACQICGTQGYYQDGKNVVCRNCGAAIYVPTIGFAGGCNPLHIDYRVEGDTLTIAGSALRSGAGVFAGRAAGKK
jgi:high-affinity iron transporter